MRLLIGAIFVWMMWGLHLAAGTFDGWRFVEVLVCGVGLIGCIHYLIDYRAGMRP